MRHEFGGIAGARIHGILAAHLDVTAKRNGGDAVIGIASAEAEQPLTKADGKDLDPHAKELSRRVMTPFVNQDHETQDHRDSDQSCKEFRHIGG